MAVVREPSSIFSLDALKGTEPSERAGDVYIWRAGQRILLNRKLVGVTVAATEKAIEAGSGTFNIELTIGSQQRREDWCILTNRRDRVLDLYLQQTSGPSLLLPTVSEPSKIARFYQDRTLLFSKFREGFDVLDVVGVLNTINNITQTTVKSSRNPNP